ncbi:SRB5 Mediator of RNA polymerase II transcription subunit 18 [Candida maltosa Xu316]
MVHQLSLVSSIPHNKYLQTVSTLQALTGQSHQQSISTYTLLTKPSYAFKPKFEPGKINQIEQYYMRCITTWSEEVDDEGESKFDLSKPVIPKETNIIVKKLFTGDADDVERVWTLQISDIPIAGKNQGCCQQQMNESTLVHTHTTVEISTEKVENSVDTMDIDPTPKVEDMKQEEIRKEDDRKDETKPKEELPKPEESNNAKDVEMIDLTEDTAVKQEQDANNAPEISSTRKDSFLIFLSDLGYEVINQYWLKGIRFFHGDIIIEIYKIFIRDDDIIESTDGIKLKLLDESNQFQIKAYINVNKSTDIDLINAGVKELIKLQEFLKNLFVLEIPDRMFMDSRIKQ